MINRPSRWCRNRNLDLKLRSIVYKSIPAGYFGVRQPADCVLAFLWQEKKGKEGGPEKSRYPSGQDDGKGKNTNVQNVQNAEKMNYTPACHCQELTN